MRIPDSYIWIWICLHAKLHTAIFARHNWQQTLTGRKGTQRWQVRYLLWNPASKHLWTFSTYRNAHWGAIPYSKRMKFDKRTSRKFHLHPSLHQPIEAAILFASAIKTLASGLMQPFPVSLISESNAWQKIAFLDRRSLLESVCQCDRDVSKLWQTEPLRTQFMSFVVLGQLLV